MIEELSIREMVEATDLKVYDFALPLDWVNDFRSKMKQEPYHFVWSYDVAKIWGEPYPLTDEARDLLAKYKAI